MNHAIFKTRSRTAFHLIAPILGAGVIALAVRAVAVPFTSPAMRQAASLKKNPPTAWLRHYLPDDRYKIGGGIWKEVSTENDTYFHRPNCPNMMRQSAGIVIGFSSAKDAAEAGYKSDPLCHQSRRNQLRQASAGRRLTLADGVASVILPAGWQVLGVEQHPPDADGLQVSGEIIEPIAQQNRSRIGLLVSISVWPGHRTKMTLKSFKPGYRPKVLRVGALSAFDLGRDGYIDINAYRAGKTYRFQGPPEVRQAPGYRTILRSFRPR